MSKVALKSENNLHDVDIWEKIHFYPPSIQSGFEKLKETTDEYIANGYSDLIQRRCKFDEDFLRGFSHNISKTQCLEWSFAKAGGIVYKFGFEWAKLKILRNYQKHLKNPFSGNGFFYFLRRDCKKGILKEYGVSCWKDLLEISLKNHTYYQRDRQSFSGQKGLQRAKAYLQKQYEKNGKIPLGDDNGCKLIAKAIRRNIWAEFGITTWGDLIYETFGFIKGTQNLWKGGGGLERALFWIKKFYDENGTLPSGKNSDYYYIINQLASSKFWKKYGISNWDDLTIKACGLVSNKKKSKNWAGIEGLETARNELIKYFDVHQKLPVSSKFSSINQAIRKGYWKEQKINSWNDLLRDLFGRVNGFNEIWMGQKGLERARKELKSYFNTHQKLPISPMFSTISWAARKGYWKEQNIESWNDLLRDTFGKVNRPYLTWKGNIGLNRAKKILIEYKNKHNKYPEEKINSNRFMDIKRALSKKYWIQLGIFTWKDLIQSIFNETQSDYHITQYFE